MKAPEPPPPAPARAALRSPRRGFRPVTRDLLRALSLANLCFLAVWSELDRRTGPRGAYRLPVPPGPAYAAAALLDTLLLAALFFAGIRWARRTGSEPVLDAARLTFLLSLSLPLNALRVMLAPPLFGTGGFLPRLALAGILGLLGIVWVVRSFRRLAGWSARAVLAFSPFLLVTFAHAATLWERGLARPRPLAVPLPEPAGTPRVLWLIFDELDQRLAFSERPSGLRLPALDRLSRQSLAATRARAPSDQTVLSIPSLLLGETIVQVRPVGFNELLVRSGGSADWHPLAAGANLFRRVRQAGFNAAVAGWAHPYDRLFGDQLTDVTYFDAPNTLLDYTKPHSLLDCQVGILHALLPRRLSVRGDAVPVMQAQLNCYEQIRTAAFALARSPRRGLLYVHWPVPHYPFIYHRDTGTFSVSEEGSYLDGLALVDRTLAELRQAMETAGTWRGTAVILTADHGLRRRGPHGPGNDVPAGDPRLQAPLHPLDVPFLVKLPGQEGVLDYDRPFSNTVVADLVMELLARRLPTPRALAAWLDARGR